jgi:hypothetical protein
MHIRSAILKDADSFSGRVWGWLCPLLLALALSPVLLLAGCGEDAYGPPRKPQAASGAGAEAGEEDAAAKPGEPVLLVGGVTMPLPAPTGFRRVPVDHPLMRAVQASLEGDELLLCLFERVGGAAGPEDPLGRESLRVSTLTRWLNMEVSSLDFLKIKQPWQDESAEFNQSALSRFEEAALGRLAAEREFNYNLGMIDSSPLHISFLSVSKRLSPAGEPVYTCECTSLVWRYGKILRISHSKTIDNFGQIQGVVAESVGYLQKLQAIDRSARQAAPPPAP